MEGMAELLDGLEETFIRPICASGFEHVGQQVLVKEMENVSIGKLRGRRKPHQIIGVFREELFPLPLLAR